jgi:hypothetical protein
VIALTTAIPPPAQAPGESIVEFVVPVPTFLRKENFTHPTFNEWVFLEKRELEESKWLVVGTEVDPDGQLLIRAFDSMEQPGGSKRRRGRPSIQSTDLVKDIETSSVRIKLPGFVIDNPPMLALWIRVQVDRAEQNANRSHASTEVISEFLHIHFGESDPGPSTLPETDPDVTNNHTVQTNEPSRKRKRSGSPISPISPEAREGERTLCRCSPRDS